MFEGGKSMEGNELLTAKEVRAWLKISMPWLRQLTQKKRIPHIRLGRRILYRSEEVETWLRSKEVKAEEARNGR
jgi:excisionase family DNA binding protein